jgi:hypothetical protein
LWIAKIAPLRTNHVHRLIIWRAIFGRGNPIVPAAKPRVKNHLFAGPLLFELKNAILLPIDNIVGNLLGL